MLTAEQSTRLNRIKNRTTAYEISLRRPDGSIELLCYSCGKSGATLRQVVRKRWDYLQSLAPGAIFGWKRGDTMTLDTVSDGTGFQIRFTGRTQRDAICDGELPFRQ